MSIEHYENFPVASILLPKELRPDVEAIYHFARSADDIADEGDALPAQRVSGLDAYDRELDRIAAGTPGDALLWQRLAATIARRRLPLQPFRDLLSAFRQDVTVHRYERFEDVMNYCARSANPVGRLMLHLYGMTDARSMKESDAICSALQLINFWQDVPIDWRKDRVYLPLEDMRRFGVSESDIAQSRSGAAWRALMAYETDRAEAMMRDGAPLALRLPGRVGWELRLVVQGGLRILEKLRAAEYDMFRRRPVLGKADWLLLLWRAWRMR